MLQPTFDMKKAFFDRQKIIDSVDRATRKAMSKSLAFVRQTARRDVLRRRKKTSQPGRAPSVHAPGGYATLRNILFAYDERTKSGIVGPVKLNQVNMTGMGSQTVPQILEFGGTVNIREEKWRGSKGRMWFRTDNRRRVNPGKSYRTRRASYRPRPFMSTALDTENQKGNISSPWANIVSG